MRAPARPLPSRSCTERQPAMGEPQEFSRVFASVRKMPRMALVMVLEFCFWTPRIIMHRWEASTTTPTPRGASASSIALAISSVSRSCTCSRRAYRSTILGIFDRPTIRRCGMYATCALPKNGKRWCSQRLYSSISRTMTIDSCGSSKTASPMTWPGVMPYPRVSQVSAFATRCGVLRRPARSGASPRSTSCRRTSSSNS